MSTCMKRKALAGSAALLSLLAVLQAPVSVAGEGHSEHAQQAAEAQTRKSAPDKKAAHAQEKAASPQMDHGDMHHDGMHHEDRMDAHGDTEAAAGSQHDH